MRSLAGPGPIRTYAERLGDSTTNVPARRPVTADHEDHNWVTRSKHSTSTGWINYQSCACGRWRIVQPPGFGSLLVASR